MPAFTPCSMFLCLALHFLVSVLFCSLLLHIACLRYPRFSIFFLFTVRLHVCHGHDYLLFIRNYTLPVQFSIFAFLHFTLLHFSALLFSSWATGNVVTVHSFGAKLDRRYWARS